MPVILAAGAAGMQAEGPALMALQQSGREPVQEVGCDSDLDVAQRVGMRARCYDPPPVFEEIPMLDAQSLDILFRRARSQNGWVATPVSDDQLRALYDILQWAPTTMNTQPMRVVFVRTPEGKERLRPALSPGNLDKTMAAPCTAILAWDTRFYENMPRTFPHRPDAKDLFGAPGKEQFAHTSGFRNASMQGGYFILAARALGLDCGPMSGFDNAKVDAEFLSDRGWKSNFLVNLGHGDQTAEKPRGPRFWFDETCLIL